MRAFILYIRILSTVFFGKQVSLEEKAISDIKKKVPSGKCRGIPKGAKLSNIKIGEITQIGTGRLFDVSYDFDVELNGEQHHKESALLYLKYSNKYILASMGQDFEA